MAFKKFVKANYKTAGRSSPIIDLEIGESWFLQESYNRTLYVRIHTIQKRYPGRSYSYQEIKNGIIIRRDK